MIAQATTARVRKFCRDVDLSRLLRRARPEVERGARPRPYRLHRSLREPGDGPTRPLVVLDDDRVRTGRQRNVCLVGGRAVIAPSVEHRCPVDEQSDADISWGTSLPSGDELASEVERFLREQRDDS